MANAYPDQSEITDVTILQTSDDAALDAAAALTSQQALAILTELWSQEIPHNGKTELAAIAGKSPRKLNARVDTPALLQVVTADGTLMQKTRVREFLVNIQRRSEQTRRDLLQTVTEPDLLYRNWVS